MWTITETVSIDTLWRIMSFASAWCSPGNAERNSNIIIHPGPTYFKPTENSMG